MIICPCCGEPMASPPPPSSLTYASVTGARRKIIDLLVAAYPRPVSNGAITDAIWGADPNGGPSRPLENIRVHVSRLNRELRPHGWQVQGDPGRGSSGLRRLFKVPVSVSAARAA